MKKIIFLLNFIGCMISGVAFGDTINVNWMVGDTVYDTSTCTIGGDLNVPIPAPTKRGHIFRGWDSLYTVLEYIESNGTQIINTGYHSESNFLRVVGKAAYTTRYTNVLFGNFNSTEVSITLYKPDGGNYAYIETGQTLSSGGRLVPFQIGDIINFDITAENGQRYGSFNGADISGSYNGSLCTSLPLCFFGSTNSSYYLFASARIYFFKIYSSSGIVRDFVPVRRNTDGAIGMFDKVTNTFFENATGVGTFIAGPAL